MIFNNPAERWLAAGSTASKEDIRAHLSDRPLPVNPGAVDKVKAAIVESSST